MSEGKALKPGDVVILTDEQGHRHNALVTIYHDGGSETPGMALNCVYVSGDGSKSDPYGRQVERMSSVAMLGPQSAHGRYYEVIK